MEKLILGIIIGLAIGALVTFLAVRHNYRNHPGKLEGQLDKFDEEWARLEVQKTNTVTEVKRRVNEAELAARNLRDAAVRRFGQSVLQG